MSKLDAVLSERRLIEPPLRRLGLFAVVALLLLAVVTAMAQLHFLPSFSADDVSSVLFGAG